MEEEEPSSRILASPRSRGNGGRISVNSGESLTSLARRFLALWSASSNRPRLHLSISEPEPNVPIISEPNLHHDRSISNTTVSAAAGTSPALLPSLAPASSPSNHANGTTSLGFGALAQAEAGVSRHLTSQEEVSDLAADAERLRLTTSTPISTLDIRQISRSVESSLPFLLLVLLVFTYHHFKSIFFLTFGTMLLHRFNTAIQQQVARRGEVERRKVFSMAVGLFFISLLVQFGGLPEVNLMHVLTLRNSLKSYEFWYILFRVALLDTTFRMVVAIMKASIVAFRRVDTQVQCRRRGALLSFIDYSTAVPRSMLPAPLWLKYFQQSNLPLSMCLSGFYLLAKATNVVERASLAKLAAEEARGGSHGTAPNVEELAAAPRECAICQDDIRNPLKLVCGHIFCEDCVEEWLARESSCPMCRREVRRARLKPRNDGATSLFPILC